MSVISQVLLEFPCRRCGAAPGQWCRTSGGHHASLLHAARYRVAKQRGVLPAVPGVPRTLGRGGAPPAAADVDAP